MLKKISFPSFIQTERYLIKILSYKLNTEIDK